MAHLDYFVVDLALILCAAGVVTVLFKKLNQPMVLGYIVAGFLISPNFVWLPTVVELEAISVWSSIGIIFLLFGIGLEFNFHRLAEVGSSAIVMASVVMTAMVALGYGVGFVLGWDTMDCVFMGCMLSISSTTIILKAYEEMQIKREKFSDIVMGTLLVEDIVGIFMMIVLTTMSVSRNFSGLSLCTEIGTLVLVLVVILCVGVYVIPTMLHAIRKVVNDEILTILAIGFCLVMVVVATSVGFSEALGAFLAGSILGGTVYGHRIEQLLLPVKNLFGAVFFVSVGMMIVPATLVAYIWPILLLSVVTVVGKMAFSALGALVAGQTLHTAVRAGFSLVQVGEFSFIIASLGASLGVTGDFLYPVIVCVSVITTFVTPKIIQSGEWAYGRLCCILPERVLVFLENYTSEGQTESTKDQDWKHYLVKYFVKMLVGCSAMLCVYLVGSSLVLPWVKQTTSGALWARILATLLLVSLSIPVLNLMNTRRSILFSKLWLKSRANILPLLALRGIAIGLSLVFVIFIIRTEFPTMSLPVLTAAALGVIVFSARSGFVHGRSLSLQTRFLANFNQTILAKAKEERGKDAVWVDQMLLVEKVRLHSTEKRKQVKDFVASRRFDTKFIRIDHPDGTSINLPGAEDPVQEGDVLYVMAAQKELDAYLLFVERQAYIDREPEHRRFTLREYMSWQEQQHLSDARRLLCAAIPVTRNGRFSKKSLAESGFVREYKGIIVGVERSMLSVALPGKDFMLEGGDIMWVLGTQDMADALIRSGLLECTGE